MREGEVRTGATKFILIMAKSKTEYKIMTLAEILPQSFKPDGEVGAEQKN